MVNLNPRLCLARPTPPLAVSRLSLLWAELGVCRQSLKMALWHFVMLSTLHFCSPPLSTPVHAWCDIQHHTMSSSAAPQHAFLVLPFTHSVLKDPAPLLPTVYNTLVHLPPSVKQLIVGFTSPPLYPSQLYDILRQDPRRHWQTFQTFLGDVYATLAAAQWRSDRVLMDVEVQFARDDRPIESILSLRPEATCIVAGGQLAPGNSTEADM